MKADVVTFPAPLVASTRVEMLIFASAISVAEEVAASLAEEVATTAQVAVGLHTSLPYRLLLLLQVRVRSLRRRVRRFMCRVSREAGALSLREVMVLSSSC